MYRYIYSEGSKLLQYDAAMTEQFRAGDSGWPYLNTLLCNPRYGPCSYFREQGAHPGLYPVFPPTGPLCTNSNLAGPELTQRFVENPTVIRPYCTSQPQFGLDVPSILPSVPNPFTDKRLPRLDVMTNNLVSGHPGYAAEKSVVEGQTRVGSVAAEPESASSAVLYIKSEVTRGFDRAGVLPVGSASNQRVPESAGYGLPRSSVIRLREDREKTDGDSWTRSYSAFSNNGGENDKCNINVIDLSVTGSGKVNKNVSVKSESNCGRLSGVREDGCKPSDPKRAEPGCSTAIKNEPYHKYLPVPPPSPFISPPLSDIFQGSRNVEKCVYDREATGSRQHDFLNPWNLPVASQFPGSGAWTADKTYINPYRLASAAGTNPPLLNPPAFDFSNPLGLIQDVPVPAATTSGTESRDQGYRYSRQTATDAPDNVDFRFPPVGFEILRDPVTGKFLLIPAASIEALQRALFWPGCQPPALLHISNNESVKNGIGATIKEEEGSVVVPAGQMARQEDPEIRLQITRNWLLEKAVKEELLNKPDVSGLELLSRGIEKIEGESDAGNLSGLGLLCALAEQRIRDEIEPDSEKIHQKGRSGRERKAKENQAKTEGTEHVTDIPVAEENGCLKEEARTEPPTLTPNAVEQAKRVFRGVKKEEPAEDEEYWEKQKSVSERDSDSERKCEERVKTQEESDDGSTAMVLRSGGPATKKRKSLRLSSKSAESNYLFRPIEPDKSWVKKEETPEPQSEQVCSFEIVHPGTESSPCKKGRTRSECKAAAAEENENETVANRRHGKLILKLRREKTRLTEPEVKQEKPKNCSLTTEMLMTDQFPMKILTVDGGLFYTGQLSAIQPPDVYGITIDGERGNRPHIYSREEILNNSILEMKPSSADVLKPGDRICAYWSGQYRSLYPGTVSVSYSPDPEPNSVSVEFDDGDSCRISVNDIRLLPENYPVTEYDPNPLLSLSKKKRRTRQKIIETKPEPTEVEPLPESLAKCEADRKLKKKHKHKKHKHKHGKRGKSERTEQSEVPDGVCDGTEKKKKRRSRGKKMEPSVERLPWGWSGKGFRRAGVKGKARKEYYRAIQRGDEKIVIGECAVFLSTGRPDRPFIGRIESMWETWGANMVVRVKWFYHPEETVGCPATLEYPGALFESPHSDENDVQTISHKCEVLPLKQYIEKLGKGARSYEGSTTLFYLAGFYDPTNTSLQFQEGVK
ncbi:UNVERIFIED_CONTAM: hypothetical protein PYX00_000567 [Menopon gallinae]|uniref:BAH domain-containing protein n=1 Tax=Menopon gallinae TaxID=328185 RepID=A0AAW2I940_9NEOP